jgi:hypothetical protein
MKIDTMQMKKNKDGSYAGEVTPTRFQFQSDKLIYPLKITQISVKDKTEALFYVQAPFKVDLQGDLSYQYQWVPMLQNSVGKSFGKPYGIKGPGKTIPLPGKGQEWLTAIEGQIPALLQRGRDLGFAFVTRKRPQPNNQGRTPTTMEWAKRLTDEDIKVLRGEAPYGDTLPNVDEGIADALAEARRTGTKEKYLEILKQVRDRLVKATEARPTGYLVRHAPAEDIQALRQLAGHLRSGLFITKFRKVFTRGEMNDDLTLVAARLGQTEDFSEYEEILPSSPP